MKKTFKKMAALLMAVAMVITSMSFTAFADQTTEHTGSVTVKGVKSGQITLYKIVENKDDKWAPTIAGTIDVDRLNAKNPEITADEIIAIAKKADAGDYDAKYKLETKAADKDGVTWDDLKVGTYLALVKGADAEVYNPMIVSVNYDGSNNELTAGEGKGAKVGDSTVAKVSEPTLTKVIDPSKNKDHGDTTEAGDIVEYKVTTSIPSWSDEYVAPVFKFSDKLVQGFDGYVADSLKVMEGTDELTVANGKLKSSTFAGGEKEFTIDFTVATGQASRTIVITYKAKISEDAYKQGFDPNKNEAKINYSNQPSDTTGQKTKEDRTYHYTFGIDGKLNSLVTGKNGVKDIWTDEVVKVNEKGEVTPISSKTYEGDVQWFETEGQPYNGPALNEAEFTLYTDADCKNKAQLKGCDNPTSSATINGAPGKINFNGLEAGTYYMKETKPPEGYASNDTVTKIIISAVFNDNGTLKSYSVKMGKVDDAEEDMVTSTYSATYNALEGTNDYEIKEVEREGSSTTYFIKNDKLGSLPATGGMGTIIFTVAGIAIMAIAAGLLIAKKASK